MKWTYLLLLLLSLTIANIHTRGLSEQEDVKLADSKTEDEKETSDIANKTTPITGNENATTDNANTTPTTGNENATTDNANTTTPITGNENATTDNANTTTPITGNENATTDNANTTTPITGNENATTDNANTTTPITGNENATTDNANTTTPTSGNENATTDNANTTTPTTGNENATTDNANTTTPTTGNENATTDNANTTTPTTGNENATTDNANTTPITGNEIATTDNANTTPTTGNENATTDNANTTTPITGNENATTDNANTTTPITGNENATTDNANSTTPTTGNENITTDNANTTTPTTENENITTDNANTTTPTTENENITTDNANTTTPTTENENITTDNANTTTPTTENENITTDNANTTTPTTENENITTDNANTTTPTTENENITTDNANTTTPTTENENITTDNIETTIPTTGGFTKSITSTAAPTTPSPMFCDSNPCVGHSIFCRNEPPKCLCVEGWQGEYCEEDIDECLDAEVHKCNEDSQHCVNKNGTHSCECKEGYKVFNKGCVEIRMIPLKVLDNVKGQHDKLTGDDDYIELKPFTRGFPYFEETFTKVFAYMNGYVSFGAKYAVTRPPTSWPKFPALFGVYWADLYTDKTISESSGLYFHQESRTDNVSSAGPILDYVKKVLSEDSNYSSFKPIDAIAITWMDATPYRKDLRTIDNFVQAQLILTTDSVQSFAIRSYDVIWVDNELSVSFDYQGEDGQKKTKSKITPLFNGTVSTKPFQCFKDIQESTVDLSKLDLPACPCWKDQADADFSFDEHENDCFKSIFPTTDGWNQICCYESRSGALIQDKLSAKYPKKDQDDYLKQPFDSCCNDSSLGLCQQFYKRFPTDNCKEYTPIVISGGFGDPHVVNMRNEKFSFNGFGEYTLFKIGEMEFQGKTSIYNEESTNLKNAGNTTYFSSFALTVNKGKNFIIGIHENGQEIKTNKVTSSRIIVEDDEKNVVVRMIHERNLVEIKVTLKNGSLSFNIAQQFQDEGAVKGIIASKMKNSLEKMKGEDVNAFAESFRVKTFDKSLFNYTSDEEWTNATTAPGNFIAMKIPTTPEDILKVIDANETEKVNLTCGSELFCLQDYFAHQNIDSAKDTLTSSNELEKVVIDNDELTEKKALKIKKIPSQNWTFNFNTNQTIQLEVDKNVKKVTFEMTGSLAGVTFDNDGTIKVSILDKERKQLRKEKFPQSIEFSANLSTHYEGRLIPKIYLCLCEDPKQCETIDEDSEVSNVQGGNVHNLACNCSEEDIGKYCEITKPYCSKYPSPWNCNETDKSSDCPDGFQKDGTKCFDVNECAATDNGGCDQICKNEEGSSSCSCKFGFNSNGTHCHDIEECSDDKSNNCTHLCNELPGGYKCSCPIGYAGKEKCFKAKYVRNLKFTTTKTWNVALLNKSSKEFYDLKDKVENATMQILIAGGNFTADDVAIEVIDFKSSKSLESKKNKTIMKGFNDDFVVAEIDIVTPDSMRVEDLTKYIKHGVFKYESQSDALMITGFNFTKSCGLCDKDSGARCETDDNGLYECKCNKGFSRHYNNPNQCQDVDECYDDNSNECQGECINILGSYYCDCAKGSWDSTNMMCFDPCKTNPCGHGKCFAVQNKHQCSCASGWKGSTCQEEDVDENAEDKEIAIICVSVILGVFILVLIVIIIVMYRRHQSYSEEENSDELLTSSAKSDVVIHDYESAKHIPRPKVSLKGVDEDANFRRLQNVYDSVDSVGRGNSTATFENRAYDNTSERM